MTHSVEPRVAGVFRLMVVHCDRQWPLVGMAREARLSVSRFSRLFREEFGVSPVRMLALIRMDQAREFLIDEGVPVKEVAVRVGMPNASAFGRSFRSRFRDAPGAGRRGVKKARTAHGMVLGFESDSDDNRTSRPEDEFLWEEKQCVNES